MDAANATPEPQKPQKLKKPRRFKWADMPALMGQANAFFNSKPWGFSGWLISILLTWYLFVAGQQKPLLKYGVFPVRSPIVRSQNVGDLKMSYRGTEVIGDISIAFVVFQNFGAGSIDGRPDKDILSTIYIQLEGGARILEASVQKMTRSGIDANVQQSSGQLRFLWKILEHDDAFIVQITYVGSINSKIQIGGEIKGQPEGIQVVEYPSGVWTTANAYNTYNSLSTAEVALILLGIISLVLEVILYSYFYSRELKQELGPEKLRLVRKKPDLLLPGLIASSGTCVILGTFLLVFTK